LILVDGDGAGRHRLFRALRTYGSHLVVEHDFSDEIVVLKFLFGTRLLIINNRIFF
jgi:hypothetical protein